MTSLSHETCPNGDLHHTLTSYGHEAQLHLDNELGDGRNLSRSLYYEGGPFNLQTTILSMSGQLPCCTVQCTCGVY